MAKTVKKVDTKKATTKKSATKKVAVKKEEVKQVEVKAAKKVSAKKETARAKIKTKKEKVILKVTAIDEILKFDVNCSARDMSAIVEELMKLLITGQPSSQQ